MEGKHACSHETFATVQDSIDQQLASRRKASPQEFAAALQQQEHHFMACSWQPQASLDDLRAWHCILGCCGCQGQAHLQTKGHT